jgi:hypothetical protein
MILNDELEMSKESVVDQFQVFSQHISGGTEQNYENVSQDSGCFGRDSDQAPPECHSEPLPL